MRTLTHIVLGLTALLLVAPLSAAGTTDTTFTYQGRLRSAGLPANGGFNMDFALWDAAAAGAQVGSTIAIVAQPVTSGVFATELDFGANVYDGTPRWLEIVVDGNTLSPRQALTAAPFSVSTRGLVVDSAKNIGIGTASPLVPLHVETATPGLAIYGLNNNTGPLSVGVRGESSSVSGLGVYGVAAATTGSNEGVRGESNSSSGRGVFGLTTNFTGSTEGVRGESRSPSGTGVFGLAGTSIGITYGVRGESRSSSGTGVFGEATATAGSTFGVSGKIVSQLGAGVVGLSAHPTGATSAVFGRNESTNGTGVFGLANATSGNGIGVHGKSNSAGGNDFFADGAGTDYGSSSSRRWKSNIRNIDAPLDKIAQLRGVYFDWDEDHGGHHDVGMIAEEVGAVLPEIVQYEENGIDADGMDYSKMTPLLVEAVNALRAEKDAEIKALRERLEKLEAMMLERETSVASRRE